MAQPDKAEEADIEMSLEEHTQNLATAEAEEATKSQPIEVKKEDPDELPDFPDDPEDEVPLNDQKAGDNDDPQHAKDPDLTASLSDAAR